MSLRAKLRLVWRAIAAVAAVGFAVVAYTYLTLPDVRVLAKTNPTTTAFWELRAREAEAEGRTLRHVHRWVPYARISQNVKRAVLVAEDSAFWDHEGVDFNQMREAIRLATVNNTPIRGASTITQQLAKNLYLSPSRDPLRKVKELIIARRLEAALTKTRILEIYLNVIEWGDGVWGIEGAARTYFRTSAAGLGREQAALLAGAIINPRVLTPQRPTRRLLRRQRIILSRMGRTGLQAATASRSVDDLAPADDAPAAAVPAGGEAPDAPAVAGEEPPSTPVVDATPPPIPPTLEPPPGEALAEP